MLAGPLRAAGAFRLARVRSSVLTLLLLLGVCWPYADSALAHTRSASYSSWQLREDSATVTLRIPLRELTRLNSETLPLAPDPFAIYMAQQLRMHRGDTACGPTGVPMRLQDAEGWVRYRWRVECAGTAASRIESAILHREAPGHLHFARVEAQSATEDSGTGVRERVLTLSDSSWELDASASDAASETTRARLSSYVGIGLEHILTGWDHLAFVIALLLLAVTVREVAGLVTAFTIAHSVTLGLAVLGIVRPHAPSVEALIGFSIALIAIENAWILSGRRRGLPVFVTLAILALSLLAFAGLGQLPAGVLIGVALFTGCHFALLARVSKPARLRAAVAFGFGLIHGFGFAGILTEMALPQDRLVPALLGFNLGVELGQLGIVVLIWPLLAALQRWRGEIPRRLVAEIGSAAVCAFGLFWFATRTFG